MKFEPDSSAPLHQRTALRPSDVYRVGALRTRLIARLTGLSPRQLQYWHSTGLIAAHVRAGQRGFPRLYSWADYMKLREGAKLRAAGVATPLIRRAVTFLDQVEPDWYLVTLSMEGGHILAQIEGQAFAVAADLAGQIPLFRTTLEALHKEGPLGELREFSDAVSMDPRVCGGMPVVQDTRIETAFVAELVEFGWPVDNLSDLYHLPIVKLSRALEFESATA